MFCIHCGRQIDDNSNFCYGCGKATAAGIRNGISAVAQDASGATAVGTPVFYPQGVGARPAYPPMQMPMYPPMQMPMYLPVQPAYPPYYPPMAMRGPVWVFGPAPHENWEPAPPVGAKGSWIPPVIIMAGLSLVGIALFFAL